jgi:hypothetical protein
LVLDLAFTLYGVIAIAVANTIETALLNIIFILFVRNPFAESLSIHHCLYNMTFMATTKTCLKS